MPEKSTSEGQDPLEESGASDNEGPEYSFEGFTVEYSEKVMLTPATTRPREPEKGRTAS